MGESLSFSSSTPVKLCPEKKTTIGSHFPPKQLNTASSWIVNLPTQPQRKRWTQKWCCWSWPWQPLFWWQSFPIIIMVHTVPHWDKNGRGMRHSSMLRRHWMANQCQYHPHHLHHQIQHRHHLHLHQIQRHHHSKHHHPTSSPSLPNRFMTRALDNVPSREQSLSFKVLFSSKMLCILPINALYSFKLSQ